APPMRNRPTSRNRTAAQCSGLASRFPPIPKNRRGRAFGLPPQSVSDGTPGRNFQLRISALRPPGADGKSASRHLLVGVDDLAPRGEPPPRVLLHVRDRLLEVFDAQRLSGDHRVERNAHHARLLAAVRIEYIELVDDAAQILLAGIAFADVE